MKIIRGLSGLKGITGSIVTIGVFDGVHRGHQHIIRTVVRRARACGAPSVVVTFDPHPLTVLAPRVDVPSVTSLAHRVHLIRELGVDYLVVLTFTKRTAAITPEAFARRILAARLGAREVYVGRNFRFGAGASAGVRELARCGRRSGFCVTAIKPVTVRGTVVSSSLIRRLIMKGALREAAWFLGRPVSVVGTVVRGLGRGRFLGFPTANIDPHHEALPPAGVYAVRIRVRGRIYNGILNRGFRPTFFKTSGMTEPTIEVNLFGSHATIYGEDLEVTFVKKLRREIRFARQEALVGQIRRDAERVRRLFGMAPNKRLYKKRELC